MIMTSPPLSVLTSSIHFVVCWKELTSKRKTRRTQEAEPQSATAGLCHLTRHRPCNGLHARATGNKHLTRVRENTQDILSLQEIIVCGNTAKVTELLPSLSDVNGDVVRCGYRNLDFIRAERQPEIIPISDTFGHLTEETTKIIIIIM